MAFTITPGELAVVLRFTTDAEQVPAPVALALKFLSLASQEMILRYAPGAPDNVHDAALVRLAGFLYDNDPTDPQTPNPMSTSGTAAILSQWRVHQLGRIGGDVERDVQPVAPGTIPAPPADGTFIPVGADGVVTWRKFPLPPGAVPVAGANPPLDGSFIPVGVDGVLSWLKFPSPP